MKRVLFFLFFLSSVSIISQNNFQEEIPSAKILDNKKLKIIPLGGIQLWQTYTFGAKKYQINKYEKLTNKYDLELRRLRLGFDTRFRKRVNLYILGAYDFFGRDSLSGTDQEIDTEPSPQIRDAYLQISCFENRVLNLTIGYFTPQIGRENLTDVLRVQSMEKAWSQNYLRRHLTGNGIGRLPGINLGGWLNRDSSSLKLKWDFGMSFFKVPVWIGRTMIQFNKGETEQYKLNLHPDIFDKNNKVEIGFSVSYRKDSGKEVSTFFYIYKSISYGIDVSVKYKNLSIDGEWNKLLNQEAHWRIGPFNSFSKSDVGFGRITGLIKIDKTIYFSPYFMITSFVGSSTPFSGRDNSLNGGFNLFFSKNFKLNFNYTKRSGRGPFGFHPGNYNNFLWGNEAGQNFQRGNWMGIGMTATF